MWYTYIKVILKYQAVVTSGSSENCVMDRWLHKSNTVYCKHSFSGVTTFLGLCQRNIITVSIFAVSKN